MKEVWKDIPEYEGYYQVSNNGNVRSVDRYVDKSDGTIQFCKGRVLTPFKGATCNYLSIQLSKYNCTHKFLIHRLVAIVFLELDTNSKLEVNHKNGVRFDNRAANLEVVTHQVNIDHSVANMLKNDYGELSTNAKLTNQQAAEIREQHSKGVLQKDLAATYGVHKQTICNIVNNKTYFK
ncbi:NUMOD4 domain-containing protein [Bacteroides sp. 224]|uniref:NUMOD4 domain-containing protein n=1 Tax=Bacteroides sp. 224 TaxID=2302936 RepID=UPI0013D3DC37|nr:NUMOD4 domain-containing protein [Bacteroides sp. 224]NDV63916.1 hypothetical protein [Bacteroides sp. 224]